MTIPRCEATNGSGAAPVAAATRGRAAVYHFLEFALAHPADDGLDWLADPTNELALDKALDHFAGEDGLRDARHALLAFFEALRSQRHDSVEAAHISLFSANFPTVPCPPYGSLFTADEAKRLEEMAAIKSFYRDSGFDVAREFDDLPDHLCVELEFLQALAHREETATDPKEVAWARKCSIDFIDRFVLSFVKRLSAIAEAAEPGNLYTQLLTATRHVVSEHRATLDAKINCAEQERGHLT